MSNNDWQEYDKTRLYKKLDSGILLIKPKKLISKVIPLECPVCGFLMRDQTDSLYFREYDCCSSCAIKWAEGEHRKERWQSGWRPSQKEIKKYIDNRNNLLFGVQNETD